MIADIDPVCEAEHRLAQPWMERVETPFVSEPGFCQQPPIVLGSI
jgi:hypothetical protein